MPCIALPPLPALELTAAVPQRTIMRGAYRAVAHAPAMLGRQLVSPHYLPGRHVAQYLSQHAVRPPNMTRLRQYAPAPFLRCPPLPLLRVVPPLTPSLCHPLPLTHMENGRKRCPHPQPAALLRHTPPGLPSHRRSTQHFPRSSSCPLPSSKGPLLTRSSTPGAVNA
jgi:hypothetical protein